MIFAKTSLGQTFVDPCFTSVDPVQSNSFVSSTSLDNVANSDVLEWDGNSWFGGFPAANITIPPPIDSSGCRVIFVGSTLDWTTSGESFGILLTNPLETGQDYSITFTYVSHGTGSNGNFSPFFYTSPSPNLGPAYLIGNLPSVGFTWTTNTVSFTATDEQAGHSWFILGTQPNGSSGLINSFCPGCNDSPETNCSVDLGNNITICEGDSVTLDATIPNATYLWQNDSTEPTFSVSEEGTYSVEVTVDNCSSVDSVFVDFSPYPTVDFGPDTTLCEGESITLNATTPNATYLWQDNSTNPTFSVTEPGVFWVEVTVNNCSSIAMTSIEFKDCEIVLEIPNVFTPNNDGSNDVFVPIVSKGITSMTTQVYNRWGNKIFETNNPSIEWQGDMVSEGTYFWIIYYTTRNGTENIINGYVTLLK